MKDDDFFEMAREWLVRVQGHARPEHEKSLSVLLRRAYNEGLQRASNLCDEHARGDHMYEDREAAAMLRDKLAAEIRQVGPSE